MTPADILAIARDPSRPTATRRAATEALAAIETLRVRLALDTGSQTHAIVTGTDATAHLGAAPEGTREVASGLYARVSP